MSKTDEASSCYGKVAWTVILKRPQISGILIVDNLTMEVAPKNWNKKMMGKRWNQAAAQQCLISPLPYYGQWNANCTMDH
ncbi:hypothetical protein G6F42_027538 [Rhizopus arrhizus]|nr:hypothetical protein G6F42_027538 [Rhizopus arrhizus]